MLRANERICACGCGQIIDIKHNNHLVKENIKRNSYFVNKNHLPKIYQGVENWSIEQGYIKQVINE